MEQSISSDLIRGHIDTIILHTLLNGDKFAQQISDSIDEKSGNSYKINQATLYSSLKRLESLKFVTSYWNDSENGRRKYFKLTESGKESVENNLSNWAYSRSIIDKLMDCAPQPIYQTQVVEKVVEKIVEVPVEKVVVVEKEIPKEVVVEKEVVIEPKDEQKQQITSKDAEQEINFRNIINGLIKTNVVFNKEPEPIKPIEKEKTPEKIKEKLDFNDTIDATDYSAYKSNSTGKIDFGDLAIKAAKEGYKLRISSKEPLVVVGSLYQNKLNFISAFVLTIIFALEFVFINAKYVDLFKANTTLTIVSLVALLAYPVFATVKFMVASKEKTNKKISTDSILTTSIIVFNLILITLAINLLANVDFSNINIITFSLIIPCVLSVDALLYFLLRYLLSKTKFFYTRTKKTA